MSKDSSVNNAVESAYISDGTPFTESGKCTDEVTFSFEDGKELFVSRNFLCYASPVFATMFAGEFMEGKSGVAQMKGKRYEEVLEFLLTLHPEENKAVTDQYITFKMLLKQFEFDNVYGILRLAEEYQVQRLIRSCQDVFKLMLQTEFLKLKDAAGSEYSRTEAASVCLTILSTAALYTFDDLKDYAIATISKFGTDGYLTEKITIAGNSRTTTYRSAFASENWSDNKDAVVAKRKECKDTFEALPDSVKIQLLRERLAIADDNKTR